MRPLPAHDRRLRSGRYEVSAYGPNLEGRRRRISGPHRFATEAAARQYAEELSGDVIYLDRVAPGNARYPEGPWLTTSIAQLPGKALR